MLACRRGVAFARAAQMTAFAIALTTGGSASAMTITFTFDSTIATNFGGNAANFQTAFNNAAAIYTSAFADPIHININVTSVTGTSTLGQSNTPINSVTWANLRNALIADTNASDTTKMTATGAGGSITAADPSGGADTFWVTHAQAKALGLIGDTLAAGDDGTITIGSGFTYTYLNPAGGVAGGTIDLQGVADHEISEIMGRIGISGGLVNSTPSLTLLDAYSYTGAATRGLGNGAGNFFSINAGTTLLKAFNNQAGGGGDSRDWASGTNDSFNAFSSSGVYNPVTALDLQELDALGYEAAANAGTPEPSTIVFLLSGLIAGGFIRRRATR